MRPLQQFLTVISLGALLACSDRSPTSPMAASKSPSDESAGIDAAATPPRSAVSLVESRGRKPVPLGVWGANQEAALTISRDGGSLQLPCAFGFIDQRVVTDASGRFDVAGNYTRMMGAVPPGGVPKYAARYSGRTDGHTMTLSIAVPDLQATIGPLTLVRGVNPNLVQCMVP